MKTFTPATVNAPASLTHDALRSWLAIKLEALKLRLQPERTAA